MGFSQTQLARKSGLVKNVVNRYENGAVDRPSVIVLSKIAKALNVPASWLCFGSEIEDTKVDEELDKYFEVCRNLSIRNKRYILITLKRAVTLEQVSNAMNSFQASVGEDYSMP